MSDCYFGGHGEISTYPKQLRKLFLWDVSCSLRVKLRPGILEIPNLIAGDRTKVPRSLIDVTEGLENKGDELSCPS